MVKRREFEKSMIEITILQQCDIIVTSPGISLPDIDFLDFEDQQEKEQLDKAQYEYKRKGNFQMTKLYSNIKRALSLTLAFAVLWVSLFTGVVVRADDNTSVVDLLEYSSDGVTPLPGSTSLWWDDRLADNGETGNDWEHAIIIDSAEELVYLCKAANDDTQNKYYKVADGIKGFNLSTRDLDIDGSYEENASIITGSGKNHAGTAGNFQGHFDGNGAIVYGIWTKQANESAGLFHKASGNVTIKNIGVSLSYITASKHAGGILGFYEGDGTTSLVIENCSVTNSHIEVTTANTTYLYTTVGAIYGYAKNWATGIAGAVTVSNCFVNLDETHFVSQVEQTQADNSLKGTHGGLGGIAATAYSTFSDCIVIGITPYATTTAESYGEIRDTVLANRFTNIYTDAPSGEVNVGGNYGVIDYTDRVFTLTTDQMKGGNAFAYMNLDWSKWVVSQNGYPELRVFVTGAETNTNAACVGEIDLLKTGDYLTKMGSESTAYDTVLADEGESGADWDNAIIIDSAEELAYLCRAAGDETKGNYYKVADGIKGFNLSTSELDIDGSYEKNANIITDSINHAYVTGANFQGHFDGNGAVVYGLCTNETTEYAGLFYYASGTVTIKNIGVKFSYISAKKQAGGILGQYNGSTEGDSLVIENCSVTESHIEVTEGDYYSGLGAIYGYTSANNTTTRSAKVKNCYINLDPEHFICPNDNKESDFVYCMHGGLVGCSLNGYNSFENCIVIGVTPYATSQYKTNDVAYVSNSEKYTNIYTDTASGKVIVGTNSGGNITYDYTDKVFSLTTDQMQGGNAFENMNLDWSQWLVTDEGYPELKAFHDDDFVCSFDATDKYAGHKEYCLSCRTAGVTQNHTYTVAGECSDCGFVCDHMGEGHYTYTEEEADCATYPTFTKVCDCGVTVTGTSDTTGGDHITSGNYQVGASTHADICKNCDAVFNTQEHTDGDNDSICDICGWICGAFEGASITLTDNIAVNYYINKSVVDALEYSDLYFVFTLQGKEYTVSGTPEDGYYVFTFDKIAPYLMADTIYAKLYATNGDTEYESKTTSVYSIKRYCYNLLEEYSDDENALLRTLLVDLLNYGAESQAYTNEKGITSYNTDEFANADLTEAQISYGTRGSMPVISVQNLKQEVIENPSVKWKSAGLYLDEETTLRFKIQSDNIENLFVKAVCGETTLEIPSDKFVKCDENIYYVYIRGINATQMRDAVDLTVYNGETAVSNTIRYSVETYASKQIGGEATLSGLLTAMMKYGDSANAYKTGSCSHIYSETVEQEAELFKAGINTLTCTSCSYSYRKAVPIKEIKILSIGNSYSRDSMRHLYSVCEAAGIETIDIASMYIGGCSLEQHYTNATANNASYAIFRANSNSREWTQSASTYTIDDLLAEGGWDIISLQHSPEGAATESAFANLENMADYVSKKCSDAKVVWFMTWAFQDGSEYLDADYNYSADTMYNMIIDCVKNQVEPCVKKGKIHSVVPVGAAVMNARTSRIKDGIHRADKSHLSYELGDYVGALTWFAHITGLSPYDVDFVASHTEANENIEIICESVENAIENPYDITQSYYTN